ncbi:hypothetical protein [Rhodococcus marinonascens]|uniref:hypothetical protein n=1 Tax=Rhodococcus marinonascens TaxID=38311 RepID=UPI000933EBE1|nr:hypothetical protein [Rhodococcus marinonascens]
MSEVRDVTAAAGKLTDAEFLEVVRAVAAGRPGLGVLLAAVDVGAAIPAAADVGAIPAEDPVTAEVVPPIEPGMPAPDYSSGGIAAPDYTSEGVPTFDSVRDRIEGRSATAIGSSELAHESVSGKSLDERWEAREKAGKAKLEEIRRSLGKQ